VRRREQNRRIEVALLHTMPCLPQWEGSALNATLSVGQPPSTGSCRMHHHVSACSWLIPRKAEYSNMWWATRRAHTPQQQQQCSFNTHSLIANAYAPKGIEQRTGCRDIRGRNEGQPVNSFRQRAASFLLRRLRASTQYAAPAACTPNPPTPLQTLSPQESLNGIPGHAPVTATEWEPVYLKAQ